MNRRQLLATVGGLGTGALAGCSSISEPRTLASPTVEREDSEVHLRFGESGDPVAVSTFMYRAGPGTETDVVTLKYRMAHREGTNVDSIELSIRAPPAGVDPPAAVYLAIPDRSDVPDVRMRSHPNTRARIVEIPDLGVLGRGTFGFDFFLDPFEAEETVPTRVGVTSAVSGTGVLEPDYRLEGSTEIEIPLG